MAIRDRETFLNNVNRLIKIKGVSPTELNRAIFGVYPGTRIPKGDVRRKQKTVNYEIANKVAEYLNTTVNKLLAGPEKHVKYSEIPEQVLPEEHTRNPNGAPSWAVPEDHLSQHRPVLLYSKGKPYLAKLVQRLETMPIDKEDVDLLVRALDRGGADVFRSVARVLDSGENGTIMALKMNVVEFEQKVEERIELRELKAIIGTMKKRQDDLEMLLEREKKGPPGLREPVDPAQHE
jgi:hypothetical protein